MSEEDDDLYVDNITDEELKVILAAHRKWQETDGKEGKRADLRGMIDLMGDRLPPTPEGIPLEVYCFCDDTDWVICEGIQADIFDHLLAIMPYFDLKMFQNPTGLDFLTQKG